MKFSITNASAIAYLIMAATVSGAPLPGEDAVATPPSDDAHPLCDTTKWSPGISNIAVAANQLRNNKEHCANLKANGNTQMVHQSKFLELL